MSTSRNEKALVLIDENAVPGQAWIGVDLAGMPSDRGPVLTSTSARIHLSAPALQPGVPALVLPAAAEKVQPHPIRGRVPEQNFVVIGRGLPPRSEIGRRRLVPPIANDNFRAARGTSRSALRELFFLCVLAATLAGAFWTGRVHGGQKVIVVPEPTSSRLMLSQL